MDTKLFLSQELIIENKYTISIEGETNNHFQTCNEYGCCDWLPVGEYAWFALTEKAREVFKGSTKMEGDILLGKVFIYQESEEFISW